MSRLRAERTEGRPVSLRAQPTARAGDEIYLQSPLRLNAAQKYAGSPPVTASSLASSGLSSSPPVRGLK